MVIDSSALIAILEGEPEEFAFRRAIQDSATRIIGTATLFEASMVALGRRGDGGAEQLRSLVFDSDVQVVPFSQDQAALALDAFRRYGKGRHRAGLNYGDCMSYALAKATGLPLLFKGDDFVHTDVRCAL